MYYQFVATQSVELAVPPQSVEIERYLQSPERIVRAIADPSCIEPLSGNSYRLRMRPLNFFSLKIEPTVDMKIWADAEGTIYLESIGCDLRGIETINEHFQLELSGTMEAYPHQGQTYLGGDAELGLTIYLPPPFSMMPKSMIQSTGNNLLGNILLKMKQGLMQQLLADYKIWANTARENTLVAA
jgi:hypothetical protein